MTLDSGDEEERIEKSSSTWASYLNKIKKINEYTW